MTDLAAKVHIFLKVIERCRLISKPVYTDSDDPEDKKHNWCWRLLKFIDIEAKGNAKTSGEWNRRAALLRQRTLSAVSADMQTLESMEATLIVRHMLLTRDTSREPLIEKGRMKTTPPHFRFLLLCVC
jgi:hypothetical protein